MCSLIHNCLEKTEMQLHHQSDQNPLWLLFLLALVPVAYYVLLNATVHLNIKGVNVSDLICVDCGRGGLCDNALIVSTYKVC
ncbi:hypothetical protein A4A49_08265 [Nicotiana attenuata]|uniref:Uncharacterized protein n=1 Tax=Nicotiana attenuata TaxID=49451 RepID=A0A1J6IVB8_NICAT|nr:hypothetical protein A4A49_08265 [Nicotiana attenuata]